MKQMIKFLASALVVLLPAVSCEKNGMDTANTSARKITLVFPQNPDSKVSLATDGKTAWKPGDQIFIHGTKVGRSGDSYFSRTVTLTSDDIKDAGKTATFTLEEITTNASWHSDYKSSLFAAYPASALKSYSDGDYWYFTSAFVSNNNLLMAGCNDSGVNDGNTFTFVHLSGALSFIVDGDFDTYTFTGNGGETVDYDVFSVRVETESTFGDKNTIPYSGDKGGVATSGAKTSVSGDVVADGSTVNYIYFPGGVNLSSGFTIKFLKSGVIQKTLSTSTGKNIAVGKYLNLGDVTTHLKTYVAPTTHDNTIGVDVSTATDLSASETANCYIVDGSVAANAGASFKFKAAKGKGGAVLTTIGGDEDKDVVVLWETKNTSTAPAKGDIIAAVDYDVQSGEDAYIVFKMPATITPGNALIAAKDAGGNILWSWHIWVPETAITDQDGTSFCGGDIMDRNLGALNVAPASSPTIDTYGLYYQWGRKDPFAAGMGVYPSVFESTNAVTGIDVDYTIANPTTRIKGSENTGLGNWNDSDIATLWQNEGKTIYDPCPPGYRVPIRNSSLPMWKTDTKWTTGTNTVIYDGTFVFPLCGYQESSLSVYKLNERTIVWAANENSADKGYATYLRTGFYASSYYKYIGGSVRCVAE